MTDPESNDPVGAAFSVLKRVLGVRANDFELRLTDETNDCFHVTAKNGRVRIAGSSAVALCRGAYEYLKEACHCQVSWSGDNLDLPAKFPDWERHANCPHRNRYYLSICTFGYSTVWWDWPRWEREIDWMALHGINMPLALCGQEKIWQTVFRGLGIEDEDIKSFFSGPAFLPWHRLGNLDGYMGPLPQSWIDGQAELQKKILDHQRELGMNPVVPGFSGFVPTGFKRYFPDAILKSATAWAGFEPTTFLDPAQELFVEIGGRLIEEYRREFGEAHHYLCETFAEQNPQFESNHELESLRELGLATWTLLVDRDPDAVWVMQGWPFYYARNYWTLERTAALLEAVPRGRMIVLDLAAETHEIWREQPAVREKGWIWNVLHNFGQTTHLYGDLRSYADRACAARTDPNRGNLLGMGIVPEGIDQNPVVYEMVTDLMWSQALDFDAWVPTYLSSRYGPEYEAAFGAWGILIGTVYGPTLGPALGQSWRFRPNDQPPIAAIDVDSLRSATELLLSAAVDLDSNPLFRRDFVDVAKTWLGGLADEFLNQAVRSKGDHESRACFFAALEYLDLLLTTLPEHRLSSWISAARGWGTNEHESNLSEANARALVTVWGGPYLFDYAAKEWAGLASGFHRERWRLYFAALDAGAEPPDFAKWETAWANSTEPVAEPEAVDPFELVAKLLKKYRGISLGGSRPGPLRLPHHPDSLVPVASEPNRHLLIDLAEVRIICGVLVLPHFGEGCLCRYALETSMGGGVWAAASYSLRAVRCFRAEFEPVRARFVRIALLAIQGALPDRFQVHLYEATTSRPSHGAVFA